MNGESVRTSEAPDPLLGRVLEDRYRVLRCIGKGGMGAVYLAEHVLIGRKVAIKALHPALATSAETVARFHREASAAAAIGNAHVVDVTDMGQLENGAHYIVLEYLEGADLAWTVASEGRLSVTRSLRIALQLCDALSAVHRAGIVHRDLKPENLFLLQRETQADFLKVLDFGVCKFYETSQGDGKRLTATGNVVGTPHYMAPEQIELAGAIDPRADLYAVGGILHFMLTGEPPFDALTVAQLFSRICQAQVPRISAIRADVSPQLDRVLVRALAKQPADRFADAAELHAALLPLMAAAERPARHANRQARPQRRHLEHSGVRASSHALQRAEIEHASTRPSMPPPEQAAAARSSATEASPPSFGFGARADTLPGRRRWPRRASVALLALLTLLITAHFVAEHSGARSIARSAPRVPRVALTKPAANSRAAPSSVDVFPSVDATTVAIPEAPEAATGRADAAESRGVGHPATATVGAARASAGRTREPRTATKFGAPESPAPQAASHAPVHSDPSERRNLSAANAPSSASMPLSAAAPDLPADAAKPTVAAPSSPEPRADHDTRSGVSGRQLKQVF